MRHEERGRDGVSRQQTQDAGYADARAVLALRQLAGQDLTVPERDGLVVGVEGERDRTARTARPGIGCETASGTDPVHVPPPFGLVPFPGASGCCSRGRGDRHGSVLTLTRVRGLSSVEDASALTPGQQTESAILTVRGPS